MKYADKAIAARSFGEWAMAFEPLSASQFDGMLSYLPPTQLAVLPSSLGPVDELLLQLMRDLVSRPSPRARLLWTKPGFCRGIPTKR